MADEGIAEGLLHWSWVKVLNHNEEGSPMNWLFKQTNASENIPRILFVVRCMKIRL